MGELFTRSAVPGEKPGRLRELATLARAGSLPGRPLVHDSQLHADYPHEAPFIPGRPTWTIKSEIAAATAPAALATLVEFQGRVMLDRDERETLARYLEHVAAGLRSWPPETDADGKDPPA